MDNGESRRSIKLEIENEVSSSRSSSSWRMLKTRWIRLGAMFVVTRKLAIVYPYSCCNIGYNRHWYVHRG